VRVNRLNSVDLPTLGRPTNATVFDIVMKSTPSLKDHKIQIKNFDLPRRYINFPLRFERTYCHQLLLG